MGGRGFAGATSRRAASLEKKISAANKELEAYDAAVAAGNAEADRSEAEGIAEYGEAYGRYTAAERQEFIDTALEDAGVDVLKAEATSRRRDQMQAELDRINHGQFALFNVTTGKAKTAEPKKQTLDEYLAERGLSSAFSDYTADKTRNPHGLTQRQKAKLEADTLKAGREYSARRNAAISEYNAKVKSGEIATPSRVEQLMKTASGHSDNASVQAARRALTKRGYDWRTGKKL